MEHGNSGTEQEKENQAADLNTRIAKVGYNQRPEARGQTTKAGNQRLDVGEARRKANWQKRRVVRSAPQRLCEKYSKATAFFGETGFCFSQAEAGGVCRRVFLARLGRHLPFRWFSLRELCVPTAEFGVISSLRRGVFCVRSQTSRQATFAGCRSGGPHGG